MSLVVVLATAASLLLFISGFFSLFTPLPFSFLFVRRGWKPALGAAGFAFLVLFLVYHLSAPPLFLPGMVFSPHLNLSEIRLMVSIVFLGYVWSGLFLCWSGRHARSWESGVGGTVGSLLVLSGLSLLLFSGLTPAALAAKFHGALEFLMTRIVELNPSLPSEEREFLTGPFLGVVWKLLPSLWINALLVIASCNILLIRRWIDLGIFNSWGDLVLWRLPERWIWLPLTAGGLYFVNHYALRLPTVGWTCLNLLTVLAAVYFFQGFAIFSFFLKRRLGPFLRMAILLLLFLFFQPLALLLVLAGLFDFWFDFRKVRH